MKTYAHKLSPPWLHGSVTVWEITTYAARKLAREWGCRLPNVGWCLVAPKSSPWRELHRAPIGWRRPYYIF